MRNIVLTGFMGAGKSTAGRRLAKRLGWTFVDTDEVIEQDSGSKISRIFKEHGEAYFRRLERKAVKKVSELENHVIVTGGGVVLDKENIEDLRTKGVIVFLHTSPETIFKRVKHSTHRPLLQVEDPLGRIRELLESREPNYANHDIQIDTDNKSVERVVKEIMEKIEKC